MSSSSSSSPPVLVDTTHTWGTDFVGRGVTALATAVGGLALLGVAVMGGSNNVSGWVRVGSVAASAWCFHVTLDVLTELLEVRAVSAADRALWQLEQDLYAGAKYVETAPGRHVCVLHTPPTSPDAPTIFFVHGSMARLSQYKHQIEDAQRRGFGVTAMDHYGCGRSHKPTTGGEHKFHTDQFLSDWEHVYKTFASSSGRNYLCGHSFGVSLVLQLTLRFEDAQRSGATAAAAPGQQLPVPDGVVLVGGGIIDPAKRSQAKKLFGRLPLWALRLLQPTLSKSFRHLALHPATINPQSTEFPLSDKDRQHRVELGKLSTASSGSNPMHVVKPFYSVGSVDLPPDRLAGRLTETRVLFISGETDGLLPPHTAVALRDVIGKGSVVVVDLASHQVMQEQPDVVNDLLFEQFVAGKDIADKF